MIDRWEVGVLSFLRPSTTTDNVQSCSERFGVTMNALLENSCVCQSIDDICKEGLPVRSEVTPRCTAMTALTVYVNSRESCWHDIYSTNERFAGSVRRQNTLAGNDCCLMLTRL